MASLFDGIFKHQALTGGGGLFSSKSSFIAAAGEKNLSFNAPTAPPPEKKNKSALDSFAHAGAGKSALSMNEKPGKASKKRKAEDAGPSAKPEASIHAAKTAGSAPLAAGVPMGDGKKKIKGIVGEKAPELKAATETLLMHESLLAAGKGNKQFKLERSVGGGGPKGEKAKGKQETKAKPMPDAGASAANAGDADAGEAPEAELDPVEDRGDDATTSKKVPQS